MAKDPNEIDSDNEQVSDPGRRWLLKSTVYVAPAILSVVAVNKAHAQASCAPSTCGPGCTPSCNPSNCSPITGCGPDGCPPP
jgi:hypothetical protein